MCEIFSWQKMLFFPGHEIKVSFLRLAEIEGNHVANRIRNFFENSTFWINRLTRKEQISQTFVSQLYSYCQKVVHINQSILGKLELEVLNKA